MTSLTKYLKGHETYILIENSTKSHDIYWILKGLGMEVTVALATDLKNITKSQRKNDAFFDDVSATAMQTIIKNHGEYSPRPLF